MHLEFNWRAEEMIAIDVQGDVGSSKANDFCPRDHAHMSNYSFVTPSSPHSDVPIMLKGLRRLAAYQQRERLGL